MSSVTHQFIREGIGSLIYHLLFQIVSSGNVFWKKSLSTILFQASFMKTASTFVTFLLLLITTV